jgi:hypothetical protein
LKLRIGLVIALLVALPVVVFAIGRSSAPPAPHYESVAAQFAAWKRAHPGVGCDPPQVHRYWISYACSKTTSGTDNSTSLLYSVTFTKPNMPASMRRAVTGG